MKSLPHAWHGRAWSEVRWCLSFHALQRHDAQQKRALLLRPLKASPHQAHTCSTNSGSASRFSRRQYARTASRDIPQNAAMFLYPHPARRRFSIRRVSSGPSPSYRPSAQRGPFTCRAWQQAKPDGVLGVSTDSPHPEPMEKRPETTKAPPPTPGSG